MKSHRHVLETDWSALFGLPSRRGRGSFHAWIRHPRQLIPQEGWHCLHLFYRLEHGQWELLTPDLQRAAKTRLATIVQETRAPRKDAAPHP
jgi:hypothetical protein